MRMKGKSVSVIIASLLYILLFAGLAAGQNFLALSVSSLTPANNATGVSISSSLTAAFNQAITRGSGAIAVRRVSDNAYAAYIAGTGSDTGSVAVSGSSATISINTPLSYNTAYYVTMAPGAFVYDTSYASQEVYDNTYWRFTTETAPVTLIKTETWIKLTWGAGATDLDSHLMGPIAGSASRFHVYYGQSTYQVGSTVYAALDHDWTSANGNEQITILQQIDGDYQYNVQDFSHSGSSTSTSLTSSGATVNVFRVNYFSDSSVTGTTTPVATYTVPTGQPGSLWKVFTLNGATLTSIGAITGESATASTVSSAVALAGLTVDNATLSPSFSSAIADYTVPLNYRSYFAKVSATLSNPGSQTMTINGVSASSGGSVVVPLPTEATTVPIVVMSGSSSQTYTVQIVKKPGYVIAAGLLHSLLVGPSGNVVAFGDNTYGQTAVPSGLTSVLGVGAGGLQSLAIGSSWYESWGRYTGTTPINL